MSEPADKPIPAHRTQRLPTLPRPGPRFYLRVRQGRVRDQRVRRLVRTVNAHLPWLEPADEPAVRAWCQLELMAEALFAEMRDIGMLRPDGEPKSIVSTYASLRKTQLQFERELGMTPAARMAIKANGTRVAFDLAAAMAKVNQADGGEMSNDD